MPFTTTRYSAQFALRLLDNIQAYLEASSATALAAIDSTLVNFADYRTPTPIVLNFPALFVSPSSNQLEQSDDDSHIRGRVEFFVDIAVDGQDAYTVMRKILKYTLAVDRILRSAAVSDILGGNTTSLISEPVWEVTEHQFGVLRQGDTIYRMDSRVIFVVQMLER